MTDGDFERLYERAGAALRAPAPDEDAARDRLVKRIHAESQRSTTRRGSALLPWWTALAAAAVAFAAGLGTGARQRRRGRRRHARRRRRQRRAAPDRIRVRRAGGANVSLVGDFNGWDASATPMRRTDGRTTWSVAVQLPAGRHVYAFVVDGDAWVADPQAPLARSNGTDNAIRSSWLRRRETSVREDATVVLACLLTAGAARAQDARLRGVLDAETLAKVTRFIDSARVESLPVDPLVGVALEGAQRHASGARITKAVQDYLGALRGARAALGSMRAPPRLRRAQACCCRA
jgi:hypothetical protein